MALVLLAVLGIPRIILGPLVLPWFILLWLLLTVGLLIMLGPQKRATNGRTH